MRTKPLTPDYFGNGMYGFNDRNGNYVIRNLRKEHESKEAEYIREAIKQKREEKE